MNHLLVRLRFSRFVFAALVFALAACGKEASPTVVNGRLAFNYDRRESDLRFKTDEALAENLPSNMKVLSANAEANFSQVVDEQERGIVLWRWCVFLRCCS